MPAVGPRHAAAAIPRDVSARGAGGVFAGRDVAATAVVVVVDEVGGWGGGGCGVLAVCENGDRMNAG